jgi:PAS domain S-box-containing protein
VAVSKACCEHVVRLQESEEKYRDFFDNAQVGLFRTRASDGKVLEANERTARMFGYDDPRQFIEECVVSRLYVDPEERERMLAIAREKGEVQKYETALRRRDGSVFWVRFSCRYHPVGDYLEGVAVDITDLKEFEEALQLAKAVLERRVEERTAELHALNCKLLREIAERKRATQEALERQQQLIQAAKMASLGTLVSGVAHEINNPNGLLLMNLPVLQEAFADALPILDEHYRAQGDFLLAGLSYSRVREEVPQLFAEVFDSARRIRRIVDDLKDFARRSEPGAREAIDLNAVVQAAARMVVVPLRQATNRFEIHAGEGLPAIRGDAQRLEQVVVNLLLNACQALPDRERGIKVATFLDPGCRQVVLEVRDEGVGIAEEHLPHLTDPFFTTRREKGGTGLGLWICAAIVEEHGGALNFRSRTGEGTVVTLTLPLLPAEAP